MGGREPCPCGSGRRYKACHGRERARAASRLVTRPYEGLPGECDWVAMREIVPAATARLRIRTPDGGGAGPGAAAEITVATVLPMAWGAMRRADGSVHLGLQTASGSGDPSRDAATALLTALAAEPGTPVPAAVATGPGPRLQDLVDPAAEFAVTVHDGFDFWLEGAQDVAQDVRDSLEQANAAVVPTRRLESVAAAYWARVGDRRHLRWVMPQPEGDLVDALARLHAAGASGLVDGSRYVGSFRADGLLVPVWDLAPDTEAEDLEEPAAAFADRLGEALARTAPLTADERRARAGVASRQITLR